MNNEPEYRTSTGHSDRRTWWVVVSVVVVAVVAMAIGAVVLLRGDGSSRSGGPPQPTPSSSRPSSTSPRTPGTTPPPTRTHHPVAFPYQPLWPFENAEEAAEWQHDFGPEGHQPWHLDAAATALGFTRGYLGYTDIDRAISTHVSHGQAWVGVGYSLPADGRTATAAVIHLVRFGTGVDAPWEVVGTRDTTLTLDQLRYGSVVHSPVRVGGRITGVDENIRVQVLQIHHGLLGETDGLPAGGENASWHDTVSFGAGSHHVITIVAATGGHLEAVERFAITGVRVQ